MRGLLGRDHPLAKIEENRAKLDEPVKVRRFVIQKKLKTPVKGYQFFEAVGVGQRWSGELLDKELKYEDAEIPCFVFKQKKDGFKAIFQAEDDWANIMVVEQEMPSLLRLKTHLKALHFLVFTKLQTVVAVSRSAPPVLDKGVWGKFDKRLEETSWSSSNPIKIPRLSLFWSHLIEGMLPEKLIDCRADSDRMVWVGSNEGVRQLGEDLINEINSDMDERIKWRLHYETT